MKDLLSDTDWHCRHNFKYENFTPLFGGLRRKTAAKSVPHVQHDYFYYLTVDLIVELWR